jgi:hypothetical protein
MFYSVIQYSFIYFKIVKDDFLFSFLENINMITIISHNTILGNVILISENKS